jgi:hypothetical protein
LNKYIDVIGGKEKLLKITDETIEMTGSIQGMNIKVTLSRKAPNKFYQLVDLGGAGQQKTIFDGVKGVVNSMGQEQELKGDALEQMKIQAALNAFLDYSKIGVKTEVTGIESINNKDTYQVTLTSLSGKKSMQYYDIISGLLIRQVSTMETAQGSVTSTLDFDDYKDIEGIKMAHKWSQSTQMGTIELKLESLKLNSGLGDALFEVK